MTLYSTLWIYLVALTIGFSAAGAISVQSSVQCSGSVRRIESNNQASINQTTDQPENPLPQTFYRLYCEILNKTEQQKFDIFHRISKRPFTQGDCRESGCNYSAWNEAVSNKHVVIDAEWGVSEQYAITVVQLRVCKVPMDHNVNRIVTYTSEQLDDGSYCKGLYTKHNDFNDYESEDYWNSRTMIEDNYVYVSSDLMTPDEVRELNKGGSHRMVLHTHHPRCNFNTPDCHISLWTPVNINCYFYDNYTDEPLNTVIWSTTYGDESYGFGIARHQRLFDYFLLFNEYDSQKRKYDLVSYPAMIHVRCDQPENHPTSSLTDTHRRLTVVSTYGPNITVGSLDGAKRTENHFYLQPDQREGRFYVMVVSTSEVHQFRVNQTGQQPQGEKVIVEKVFRNSLNYTTMYTLILSELTPLIENTFKIETSIRSSYFHNIIEYSITMYITILTEIDMVINPYYAAVVHGDASSEPSFLCIAVGYPTPTITWSAITNLRGARQIPANSSLLPRGYTGVYLQFPSGDRMRYSYSGEYTCTVSNPLLGTKQATAILMILEPGSTYDIFNQYVSSEKTGLEEDIEGITDEEVSLLRHLDSPFITEAHRVVKEHKEVVVTSMLALAVGVIVIISLVVWVIVKICRRRKQLKAGYSLLRKKKKKKHSTTPKDD